MPPPDGDDESATPILRNMSSRSIPLVPPMDDETASARSANAVDGWPSRSEPAASLDATSSAPRFMVRPQSPSPTMVSYLVRSGSASASAAEQAASAARARSAKSSTSTGGSCAGPDAVPGAAAAATSGISDDDGRAFAVLEDVAPDPGRGRGLLVQQRDDVLGDVLEGQHRHARALHVEARHEAADEHP
ncbi:hypothetical protein THAOC_08351, partial [Thalassiosira oceanica]